MRLCRTRRTRRSVAVFALASALVLAGCGRSGDGGSDEDSNGQATAAPTAVSADFGDLKQVCRPGNPSGSPAQGVTDKEIKVGTLTDVGFTKKPEFGDVAKVFTAWCNDAGGINGRKLSAAVRDTKLTEVRQRVTEACSEDFALVGGGAGLDALGVRDRLNCLLPEFPAQTATVENQGSDLQISIQPLSPSHWPYEGFYNWLTKEAYPASAGSIGIIAIDAPVTKVSTQRATESLRAIGANVTYTDLYPAAGVSDWTPYAQSIKNKGVKGLVFLGDFRNLAKLEQVLTSLQYKPDWIDANSNAYGPAFLELAGKTALAYQNNLADLGGFHPLETASSSPAVQQMIDLYAKYAPGSKVSFLSLKAFSAWLVFAKAAVACGDNLTRKCLYETAAKETNWAGGGLQAPIDLSQHVPVKCYNVVQATPDGWKPADFKPDTGAYRCDAPATALTGDYGKPLTLADVGKSLNDLR
ncbi:ABC transporter substrate-binding protein [Yinghuangia sp. YIM S10712]|uniref:ABC transporter substrate-binding protein n=1 Tax=Yinghuangia sp. YIM S10712 TaxID=3436930 RepID=UPI003F537F59